VVSPSDSLCLVDASYNNVTLHYVLPQFCF